MKYIPAMAALFLVAGCGPTSSTWRFLEPIEPLTQGTSVTIGKSGDTAFFFECTADTVAVGITPSDTPMTPGESKEVTLQFDKEPAETAIWRSQLRAYVLSGPEAIPLANRTALAYNVVFTIDGKRIPFSLKGSHVAMIRLNRVCPVINVK